LAPHLLNLVGISNLGIDFRLRIAYTTILEHELQRVPFRHPPNETTIVSSVGWVYNF
jgi:hypothetical protein